MKTRQQKILLSSKNIDIDSELTESTKVILSRETRKKQKGTHQKDGSV